MWQVQLCAHQKFRSLRLHGNQNRTEQDRTLDADTKMIEIMNGPSGNSTMITTVGIVDSASTISVQHIRRGTSRLSSTQRKQLRMSLDRARNGQSWCFSTREGHSKNMGIMHFFFFLYSVTLTLFLI